jgi:hypothetical protein
MVCHVLMMTALLWRTAEPGFSAYRTSSCTARGRAIVPSIEQCARAADWYSLPSKYPLHGENRSRPLSLQPPGCYYSSTEEQLFYNPLICSEDEQVWLARPLCPVSPPASIPAPAYISTQHLPPRMLTICFFVPQKNHSGAGTGLRALMGAALRSRRACACARSCRWRCYCRLSSFRCPCRCRFVAHVCREQKAERQR